MGPGTVPVAAEMGPYLEAILVPEGSGCAGRQALHGRQRGSVGISGLTLP